MNGSTRRGESTGALWIPISLLVVALSSKSAPIFPIFTLFSPPLPKRPQLQLGCCLWMCTWRDESTDVLIIHVSLLVVALWSRGYSESFVCLMINGICYHKVLLKNRIKLLFDISYRNYHDFCGSRLPQKYPTFEKSDKVGDWHKLPELRWLLR
jgi:hypothetical protein